MHKSVAIGKVAVFNRCGSGHGNLHAIIWVYAYCDLFSMWCYSSVQNKKGQESKIHPTLWHDYDEKVVCLTGAAHEDRCAWNICLFYHIGWYCIARLKSHLTIGIRLGWRMTCQKRATITQCSWHSQYKCQEKKKKTFMTEHLFFDGKSSQRYNIWSIETGFWT